MVKFWVSSDKMDSLFNFHGVLLFFFSSRINFWVWKCWDLVTRLGGKTNYVEPEVNLNSAPQKGKQRSNIALWVEKVFIFCDKQILFLKFFVAQVQGVLMQLQKKKTHQKLSTKFGSKLGYYGRRQTPLYGTNGMVFGLKVKVKSGREALRKSLEHLPVGCLLC